MSENYPPDNVWEIIDKIREYVEPRGTVPAKELIRDLSESLKETKETIRYALLHMTGNEMGSYSSDWEFSLTPSPVIIDH